MKDAILFAAVCTMAWLFRQLVRTRAALRSLRHFAAIVADEDPNPELRIVAGIAVDKTDAILGWRAPSRGPGDTHE